MKEFEIKREKVVLKSEMWHWWMHVLKLHNTIVHMVCLEIYNKNATVFSYNIFAESLQSKGQLQLTAQEHAKAENPKEKKNFSRLFFSHSAQIIVHFFANNVVLKGNAYLYVQAKLHMKT